MAYYENAPGESLFADKILKWIVDILIVVVLGGLVIFYFGKDVTMSGNSMSNVIENEETVLIERASYHFTSPKRYDIILFRNSEESGQDTKDNLKRIIGLPGETLQIIDGYVYVDEKKIDFNDGKEMIVNAGLLTDKMTLGSDEYFVIGDNWNSSEDSRFENIGNVKRDMIIGKVWFRISPFKRIGRIKNGVKE